jgi:hypothetical protein
VPGALVHDGPRHADGCAGGGEVRGGGHGAENYLRPSQAVLSSSDTEAGVVTPCEPSLSRSA